MSVELYVAFVVATTILVLIPGPNVTLIVANSIAYGSRYAITTVAGTSSAMLVQLALTLLGMTSAMAALADWFEWLRWVGVAYLMWLGLAHWRRRPEALSHRAAPRVAVRRMFWQGFGVSLTNPKTLLFYAAFFPQFVDVKADPLPQFLLLASTFLLIAVSLDSSWCLLAGR